MCIDIIEELGVVTLPERIVARQKIDRLVRTLQFTQGALAKFYRAELARLSPVETALDQIQTVLGSLEQTELHADSKGTDKKV
jgi:hypothetical protein